MAVSMHTVALANYWHLARKPDGKITRVVDDLESALATFAQRLDDITPKAALPSTQTHGRVYPAHNSIKHTLEQIITYLKALESCKEAVTGFADAVGGLVVTNERKSSVRYAS